MGPAQQAGQALDHAGQQVADSAEQTRRRIAQASAGASEGLDQATGEVGKQVERAGENMQEAAKQQGLQPA